MDVGAGFQEMFFHVIHEVVEQLHLLLEVVGKVFQSEVVLNAFVIDVVNVTKMQRERMLNVKEKWGGTFDAKLQRTCLDNSKNIILASHI